MKKAFYPLFFKIIEDSPTNSEYQSATQSISSNSDVSSKRVSTLPRVIKDNDSNTKTEEDKVDEEGHTVVLSGECEVFIPPPLPSPRCGGCCTGKMPVQKPGSWDRCSLQLMDNSILKLRSGEATVTVIQFVLVLSQTTYVTNKCLQSVTIS